MKGNKFKELGSKIVYEPKQVVVTEEHDMNSEVWSIIRKWLIGMLIVLLSLSFIFILVIYLCYEKS